MGLIVSTLRPSDDATTFPFLVPSNHFAVVALRQLAEMTQALQGDEDFWQGHAPALAGWRWTMPWPFPTPGWSIRSMERCGRTRWMVSLETGIIWTMPTSRASFPFLT